MQPEGPLSGITVVECASIVLGPMAAQYLGDMGADVIKIEPPAGDLTRQIGPRRSERMGAFFLSNNRNKRSVVLDLKVPESRDVLRRLVAASDVLLHSIRSSAAARIGLDHASLAEINERLVYCQVTGFTDSGPYGGRPAFDDVVQALSGLAVLQRVVAGEPRYMPAIFADKVTAVHAAHAVVLALFHRERTGRGQRVEVPMFETLASFNTHEHLWGHAFEPPEGPMGYRPVVDGSRRPFPTSDGYLSCLPYTDAQLRRFFELAGRPETAADERFATLAARQRHAPLVWGEIAREISTRSSAEWAALLDGEDIPHAVVNSLEDLLDDPHLAATGFWQLHDDPVDGTRRMPSPPIQLAGSPASIRRLPPRLGADTDDVLREIGLDASDVERLVAAGAVVR